MAAVGMFRPATLWRAFFVYLGLVAGLAFAGPPSISAPPPLAQVGKPTSAESARILDQFRHAGWHGYVEFDLHALPRRGDETVYRGRLWGGENDQGAVTRIELIDAQGTVHRLLLQNGAHPAVWQTNSGKVALVDGAALFQPLIPGTEITAFDLQMPYLYWPGAVVESVTRMRGRPAYEFVFHPPADFALRYPELVSVHAYFDAQFNAPVQVELTDAHRVVKTTSLVDLKQVGGEWIPKSFDVRDELSRDKTRFEVTAVALRVEFSSMVFTPAALAEAIQPPRRDRIVPVGP